MSVPYETKFGQPILSPEGDDIWGFWNVNKVSQGRKISFFTGNDLLGIPSFDDKELDPASPPTLEKKYVFMDSFGNWRVNGGCTQRDLSDCPWFITSPLTGDESIYQAIVTLNHSKEFRSIFGLNSPSNVVFHRVFKSKWRELSYVIDDKRRRMPKP